MPAESAATVSALARLHDLTIVLQPEPGLDTADNTIPAEILFQSGGPVVLIPYAYKGPFEPKHIGIAWDGSRLAARALRDAAPFLARAQAVTIVTVNATEIPAELSAADPGQTSGTGASLPRTSSASTPITKISSRLSCRLRPTPGSI